MRERHRLSPSIVTQVLTRQRSTMVAPSVLTRGVVSLAALAGAMQAPTNSMKRAAKLNHSGGVSAPPMPEGPTRCVCGSGKRPKKCCGRAVQVVQVQQVQAA